MRTILERLRALQEIDMKVSVSNAPAPEMRTLQEQRQVLLETVPTPYRFFYERIKRARGTALASVSGQVCDACFRVLPAQLIIEVRKRTELHQCPSCKRILDPGKE